MITCEIILIVSIADCHEHCKRNLNDVNLFYSTRTTHQVLYCGQDYKTEITF